MFKAEGWQAPAWPLLLMTLFFVLVYVLGPILTKLIKKVFPNYLVDEKKLEIEVEIDNYWRALD